MRRYCRLFSVLCAFALFLTACGGAPEEAPDGFTPLPGKQAASGVLSGQGAPSASETPDASPAPETPDESDASPVSGETDAQTAPPVSGEQAAPEERPGTDEPDAPPASETPDAPPASDEQGADFVSDEQNAQLSGEALPEVTAMGEGVSVGTLTEVYLPESGRYLPFLVVEADYGGNALLLRREVLPEPRPFNSYSAAYEDSAIDRFLNGEYLQRLEAVGTLIRAAEIVVTDADALGVSGEEVKTLTRNVFLLSGAETGFDIRNAGQEGSALPYFNDVSRRIAYGENGAAASWWLRTPDAYYLSAAYGVGPDGSLGSGNAYNENGVRPALCVASDAQAFPTADIVAGQSVYFLAS